MRRSGLPPMTREISYQLIALVPLSRGLKWERGEGMRPIPRLSLQL